MKAFGLTLRLRDDPVLVARYKEYHQHVWPSVTARLRDIGITDMEIFLAGRRLFMRFAAPDDFVPARDFAGLAQDAEYRKWDELMRTMQEPIPEARPGEWWSEMEEVFNINWPQHR